jgi:SH3 domain protein
MRSIACAGALLASALLSAGAQAESLYVIDQLIVSVSSSSDESGERIASIHSGDSVQVLERHEAYSHVRLTSGTEGWVKSSYLSPEPPLQQKLAAQLQEIAGLKQEVARLQAAASAAPTEAAAAHEQPVDPPAAAAVEQPQNARPLWQWLVGGSFAALVAGFALGWRMLDRRIRRKYGGLRIY